MKRLTRFILLPGMLVLLLGVETLYSQPAYLQKKGTTEELIVDGKPFLVLGGELGNSTASSMKYMQPFWARFKAMHLNTILAPVYWELIEPEEGKFNFSLLDSLLNTSRANNLKLVLLWF